MPGKRSPRRKANPPPKKKTKQASVLGAFIRYDNVVPDLEIGRELAISGKFFSGGRRERTKVGSMMPVFCVANIESACCLPACLQTYSIIIDSYDEDHQFTITRQPGFHFAEGSGTYTENCWIDIGTYRCAHMKALSCAPHAEKYSQTICVWIFTIYPQSPSLCLCLSYLPIPFCWICAGAAAVLLCVAGSYATSTGRPIHSARKNMKLI